MNIHTAIKSGTALAKALDAGDANPRAVIGGNGPPTCVSTARGVYATLAAFLKNVPVIQSAVDAKTGANLLEQGRATLGEMEGERRAIVDPLNAEVSIINDRYRAPREAVQSIMDELKRRLTTFAAAEEAERARKAEAAREAAQEAERIAREAERIEADAKARADVGECDLNVAAVIAQADRTFATFKRADRNAARAEKETTVRLNGGFGRAVTMRKSETLVLDDATAAIAAMGVSDGIRDAILSAARSYRKLNGRLPAGVSAETERKF